MNPVRPATTADAAAIADAQLRCWRWAYRGILRDEFLDGMNLADNTRNWQERLADNTQASWVGLVGGKVQGMIVAAPAHWPDMPVNGMVRTFYIAPEATRMGLGRQLWNAAHTHLRQQGHDGLYVMVMEANRIGRSFYKKMNGIQHPGNFTIALDGIERPDCCYYWKF